MAPSARTALLLLVALALCALPVAIASVYADRGLPDDVEWMNFDDAMTAAQENGKPTLVLLTKPWCGACKSLKTNIGSEPDEFVELSKHFNMVNLEEDSEEPSDSAELFQEDGAYIPRVYFVNPDRTIDNRVTAPNPKYKHFFGSAGLMVSAMKEYVEEKSDL